MSKRIAELAKFILGEAKSYPEATESHPWGETAFGVRKKNFLFLRHEAGTLSFSVKLPRSANQALALPFTKPTEYGLGRHGWVTCTLTSVPAHIKSQVKSWLDESYSAVAPKTAAAKSSKTHQ